MCLDCIMEFFSVLIELHDALWFFCHPEFIKFIRQITWKRETSRIKKMLFFYLSGRSVYILKREVISSHSIADESA